MSTKLKPDEKVCPFCAEVIKAAAIRCRYCGSDLTDVPGTVSGEPVESTEAIPAAEPGESPESGGPAESDEPAQSGEPAEPPASDGADHPDESAEQPGRPLQAGFLAHRRRLSGPFLAIPLAGLVVALLLVLLLGIVPHLQDDTVAPSGEQTSTATREVLMDQASKMTATALSYDAKTLDKDTAAAGKLMTASMRKQYLDTLAQVRDEVAKEGLVLKADVVASALVSATVDEARVLEFVNQSTTAKGVKRTQVNQNRVVVTLTRTDGRWLISKMDAF